MARVAQFGPPAWDVLDRHGIQLTPEGQGKFLTAVADAVVQGDRQLLKNAVGDYRPDPDAARFPEFDLSEKEKAAGQSLVALYDVYAEQVMGGECHGAQLVRSKRPTHRDKGPSSMPGRFQPAFESGDWTP